MSVPAGKGWLSVSDLMAHFQVTRPTIKAWMRQGRLPRPIWFNARMIRWPASVLAGILHDGPATPGSFASYEPPPTRKQKGGK